MRFLGKKAVVTDGTHGMGLAVVRALLDGGAEVLLTGRDGQNLANARAELSGKAHVVGSDAAGVAEVAKLGETGRQTLGEVDLVFVNVGFASLQPLPDVTARAAPGAKRRARERGQPRVPRHPVDGRHRAAGPSGAGVQGAG
ncbi:SDR family NAD(P)-dependent oxidoreductase [Amycolatopsis saalfeldensis]|uniref:Short chain dehydrogenase n=1 Tax=Amycolatopsis saalfeldensis TaxID=394193 RepID=A0A1H8YPL3_9PSEU|nr:SDR family NAD(P)-dependent oxidoreductase [Amycolatopsis saalfeldensis]SEP54110.1 short chain dehydrogenase [Amycolatopsis saalfeldensis]